MSANPSRLLRRDEVESLTGLAVSTLYERISKGDFPRPVRVTPRRVAWLENEVADWISSKVAASRGQAA